MRSKVDVVRCRQCVNAVERPEITRSSFKKRVGTVSELSVDKL